MTSPPAYRRGDRVHLLHPDPIYERTKKARPTLCGWVSLKPDETMPTDCGEEATCLACLIVAHGLRR